MLVLSISIAESSAPTDADSPLSTPVHAHTSAVMATATATAMAALTFGRVADAAQALPQPWFAPMRFLRPASSRPSTHMYILHALITRLLFRVSPSTIRPAATWTISNHATLSLLSRRCCTRRMRAVAADPAECARSATGKAGYAQAALSCRGCGLLGEWRMALWRRDGMQQSCYGSGRVQMACA